MIDAVNVKVEGVGIHQVFSEHACLCSLIWLQGKDSDASRKQTSPEMICEIQADRQREGERKRGFMQGNEEMQAEMRLTS